MNLPSIAVKISGTDGVEGSEWSREFVLHMPSLTMNSAPRLLSDAEGSASLLLTWSKYLREFLAIGLAEAARDRQREERIEGA